MLTDEWVVFVSAILAGVVYLLGAILCNIALAPYRIAKEKINEANVRMKSARVHRKRLKDRIDRQSETIRSHMKSDKWLKVEGGRVHLVRVSDLVLDSLTMKRFYIFADVVDMYTADDDVSLVISMSVKVPEFTEPFVLEKPVMQTAVFTVSTQRTSPVNIPRKKGVSAAFVFSVNEPLIDTVFRGGSRIGPYMVAPELDARLIFREPTTGRTRERTLSSGLW